MDYRRIYEEKAEDYDVLVRAEDVDGNLGRVLDRFVSPGGRVLEVGVGTGRVTALVVARGATVLGCELARAMLVVAQKRFATSPAVELVLGDLASVTMPPERFDVAIAGWVFGHLVGWQPDRWRQVIGDDLERMERAVSPRGTVIIVETLGTAQPEPGVARADLAAYHAWLEERGYTREVIRTDYLFDDAAHAATVLEFFFGAVLGERVRVAGAARVPEHTGVWTRTLPA